MNKITIAFILFTHSIILSQMNASTNIFGQKCPENCEFGYNFLNRNDTWTCKCAKDICEELECASNSTCKIKYRQKCEDNLCTRSKTVYCQSNKKDGLCPSSVSLKSSNKTCLQDVDCSDNDKCCPNANGVNFCSKPCFKPKCNCKQNFINEYTTNSKGCPMCLCIKKKLEKIEICSQPKEIGPCRAAHNRYYFNSSSKKCEQFIYGGCHGNENNFLTLGDCEKSCNAFKIENRDEKTKCELNKETGPCKGSFQRYFYNHSSKSCENFIYGGCQGNANNFESLDECTKECSIKPRALKTKKCNSDPDGGFCRAYIERYFFNKTSGRCEIFIYGGCGGNENNFGRIDDCLSECTKISIAESQSVEIKSNEGTNICGLDKEVGPCKAYFERYYYNKNTRSCEKFGYGGCKGNANNFHNKEECQRECVFNNKAEAIKNENNDNKINLFSENENVSTNSKPELCLLEKSAGDCEALIPRYFFNKLTSRCEQFIWGGCGGNENNFPSEAECNRICNSSYL